MRADIVANSVSDKRSFWGSLGIDDAGDLGWILVAAVEPEFGGA